MEIFRQQTQEEKKDFKDLLDTTPTLIETFRKQAEVKQAEYLKKGKPYCYRCARYDFLDWVDKNKKEMERTQGFLDFEKLKAQMPDIEIYGNENRFKFIKETEIIDPGKWKGDIPKKHVYCDYICNVRQCKLSILVSDNENMSSVQYTKQ